MWQINDEPLHSRLLIGSALYPSPALMQQAITASASQVVTVSLRRETSVKTAGEGFWSLLKSLPIRVLPNTAGCLTAREAINTALLARELFGTHWVKLEVIGGEYHLQPEVFGLVEAARELVAQDFTVLPYCTEDLGVCEQLLAVGCQVLMPWAAPIGSARGPMNPYGLRMLREYFPGVTMIVDAGLGTPSHACQVMEMGFDAVLLNSAIALADDPVRMAAAFRDAVRAGRSAREAGLMTPRDMASPSTPVIGRPFADEGEW